MKTLSIQQPWASLVCAGIKDVENRTWKAAQVPGRILIHASSKKITKNFYAGIPEALESCIENQISFGNIPELETLPTSAIIGYVTVTGFEEGDVDSVWADAGAIKWKLEDAWLFDEPILDVKGKLNLFDYDLDENNLPPAHQVQLENVDVTEDETEVQIPCTKETFEKIKAGDFGGIELYLTPYLTDLLCVDDAFKMKSFKTATVFCGNSYVAFELAEESGIYNLPDPQDETKPYFIMDFTGNEIAWMVAQFMFGKKIEEGEFESFCGGKTIDVLEIPKMADSNDNILKLKVNKDVFKDIATGKMASFTKEITPKNLSMFFILNADGTVKEINGIPQLRRYDAIQFTNKEDSYTCQINNADVMYMDSEYGDYKLYSEQEEDEKLDYTDCIMNYVLGDKI